MREIGQHLKREWYKYVLDTIVVIVGILIAFALNNWNDNRIKHNLMQAYAGSLETDLRTDIEEIKKISSLMEESIIRIDSLANYTRSRSIPEISNLDLLPLAMGDNQPYAWSRATIDELKVSGALRHKDIGDLSKKIVAYDAMTRHMDEDYYVDLEIKESIAELAAEVVNFNYSNFDELSHYMKSSNSIKDYDFAGSEAYLKAEKEGLGLLTDDVTRLQELVNRNLRLRNFLVIRSKYELPRLIEKAEGIIEVLEENYLE